MSLPAGEYLLEARGVRKSFGRNEVLRGVDLLVRPRELVFLIGPSGSGKSTLLRCCNRLEEPTGGTVHIDGVDLLARSTDINKVRQRVGMVFQSFNLYPHLTALGNVTLALRKALGRSRAEADRRSAFGTSNGLGSPTRRAPTRPSCRAGSSSASPSPGPWLWSRRSC